MEEDCLKRQPRLPFDSYQRPQYPVSNLLDLSSADGAAMDTFKSQSGFVISLY